jgi:hypothetical protein
MAVVTSHTVHDLVQTLVDTLDGESDVAARLHHYAYLGDEWRNLVIPHRDAAAYEARLVHTVTDLARLAQMDTHTVIDWYRRHREATGAPPAPIHRWPNIVGSIDLTGLTRR